MRLGVWKEEDGWYFEPVWSHTPSGPFATEDEAWVACYDDLDAAESD